MISSSPEQAFRVAALYRFASLPDHEALRSELAAFCCTSKSARRVAMSCSFCCNLIVLGPELREPPNDGRRPMVSAIQSGWQSAHGGLQGGGAGWIKGVEARR